MKDLKIFTDNVDSQSIDQINTLLEQAPFKDCKVRIMPDVHVGIGCVIGFTADLGDKVIPNVVGVDLNCGILTINLGKIDINFPELDDFIKRNIPTGFSVHRKPVVAFPELNNLNMFSKLKNVDHIRRSLGTLGGGNHFIEVDQDEEGNKYLIIHSGSRNLGHQVASYYQNIAINLCSPEVVHKEQFDIEKEHLIEKLTAKGKEKDINKSIKNLKEDFKRRYQTIPKDLCYLEGEYRDKYLEDVKICKSFAVLNRQTMANIILEYLDVEPIESFETIHNYIGDDNIIRKGAIAAYEGQKVLIPINMRDGCIIAEGKGNPDWNYSAPHGAGRILSRRQARQELNLKDFKDDMSGIYTTTAVLSTIDESPKAYKSMDEIIDNTKDTIKILKVIKPLYNFKAT